MEIPIVLIFEWFRAIIWAQALVQILEASRKFGLRRRVLTRPTVEIRENRVWSGDLIIFLTETNCIAVSIDNSLATEHHALEI